MKKKLSKFITSDKITIFNAFRKINTTAHKGLIVIDNNGKLIGTLTDGDLRHAITSGAKLNQSIKNIFKQNPFYVKENNFDFYDLKKIILRKRYDLIPEINSNKELTNIYFLKDIFKNGRKEKFTKIDVVIMAGGLGKRLKPFTSVLPKPLIPINGKPIIQIIIDKINISKKNKFYLSLNYKNRIIRAFFEELKPSYKVSFVYEKKDLGTIGAIGLLKKKFTKPFIVTNCDVIIDIDYMDLKKFHFKNNYDFTIVVTAKTIKLPYGNCEVDSKGNFIKIFEKPKLNFLVNSGMYVINPNVIDLIPTNKKLDIDKLITTLKSNNYKIGLYPISEKKWTDVGEWSEFKKAINKFEQI